MLSSVAMLGWLALSAPMESSILALRLCKGAFLVAVSTILFRRRKTDKVAALLSLAFLLWIATSSFDVAGAAVPLWIAVADRLRFLLFVFALLLFPNSEWSPSWTRHLAIASCGVFALGIGEAAGAVGTRLYLPLAILCVLGAVAALLVRFRSTTSTAERQQMKWIALGLSTGIALILFARVGAAISDRLPQLPFAGLIIEALFQLGIIAIAVGFLVSLLRYRLYDAETIISRSAAYAALTLTLVATFAATEALIEMLGQKYFGMGLGNVSAAMAAAVAAVLLTPLHGRVTAWAERRFQRDLVVLKEQLPDLLAELSGLSSPARVGDSALLRIEQALYPVQIALLLDGKVIAARGDNALASAQHVQLSLPLDTERSLEIDRASAFPVRIPMHCPFGSLRGWLLLGARPDGSPYARDELDALLFVLPSLKRSLLSARERELEREAEQVQQQSLREVVRELEDRLSALEQPTEQGRPAWTDRVNRSRERKARSR
jgi:hypothetical protein